MPYLPKQVKEWVLDHHTVEDLVYKLDIDPIDFLDTLDRMGKVDLRILEAEYLADFNQGELDFNND
jgi:hypothetical protein